jgi:hypothetical protein
MNHCRFSLRPQARQGCLLPLLILNTVLEILYVEIKPGKTDKRYPGFKGISKTVFI